MLTFDDALRIARGCTDYGGGYRNDPEHYDIYQHGIETVIATLAAASETGLEDTQVAALHVIGRSDSTDVLGADAAIARANAIDDEIENLRKEQDSLLDPLATAAMLAGDVAVMELISRLPSGFHRSELRTECKQGDSKRCR